MDHEIKKSELRSQLEILKAAAVRVWGFTFLAGLLALSPTIYMMEVYARVLTSRDLFTLLFLTLLAIGIYAITEILHWISSQIMQEAGRKIDENLNDKVLDSIFSSKLNDGGRLGQQGISDLRVLRDFIHSQAFLSILEVPVTPIFLFIMFSISTGLGYFVIFGAVIQLGLVYITERLVQPPLAEANVASSSAQGFAGNVQKNAEVVYAMGMLDGVRERWLGLQKRFLRLQALASDNAGILSTASKTSMLIQGSVGLGLSFWLMTQGEIASGGLAIFGGIAGGRVLAPLVAVVTQWRLVVEARGAYSRLDVLLGAKRDEHSAMELPIPEGNLSVEGVTAGAPGNPIPIIHNINFRLDAGECLAVIGPSASGKTTLAKVLLGLWPTQNGKVRLDAADIHMWDKADLGQYLGYLPQDVELFDGTLAENIARFSAIDEARLEDAVKWAGLRDVVSAIPGGLHAQIGSDGGYLSGGQRQRVGLARAIYGSVRFIVLDEPNSSLDDRGEGDLLHLLLELKKRGVTSVVVTHRTSIMRAVDKILVMVDGRVKMFGGRDEVMSALQPKPQPQPSLGAAA